MRLPTLNQDSLPTLKPQQTNSMPQHKNYGRGRGGRPWRRIKQQVHERDQWTCQKCGRVTMELECDHIINQAQGGTDDLDNLQSLCVECHTTKTKAEAKLG